MARERPSLQDRIRGRQQRGFVGRQGEVAQYQENLGLPFDDERRRFLFNIHGDAGVGKTYLTKQLCQIAIANGALAVYIDETIDDVTAAMAIISEESSRQGVRLGEYEKRYAAYLERRHELESDPQAPDTVATFLTKTTVTIGLAAARDVPIAGSLLAPVNAAAMADQVDRARRYLARKFSNHSDVRLLLTPIDELSSVLVSEVNRAGAGRSISLFFDTYERTGPLLDRWLRSLYAGQYGELPESLITTISGQKPLNPNLWGEYLPVIADIALEPFSDAEARQFLASRDLRDEDTIQVVLTLSGRLPMWLVTLAEARPASAADIGDPSGDAVERFLKWEDEPVRRNIAITAALPRILNQDVLGVITASDTANEFFSWLCSLPFVTRQAGGWVYHEVVRAAMLRLQYDQAPVEWHSRQIALAEAYRRWAREAARGSGKAWANPGWIDHTREATYHFLCADPVNNLAKALAAAVKAGECSSARARQWAELIADAGRDTNHPALCQWGRRLRDTANDDDLRQYFTSLIDDAHLDNQTLITALKERGACHKRIGHYDEAIADYSRIVELDPDDTEAFGFRGEAYRQTGRYEEAVADFTRAIEIDPGDAWAIGSRGQAYDAMGRFDEALADFTHAIELEPARTWILSARGETYLRMGRLDGAATDFTRAIELDPEHDWNIVFRGETYRQMGRYEEAVADFTRAIEIDPGDAWATGSRGRTYEAMGRFDEALADFKRTIELDPTRAWVLSARDETGGQTGPFEQALADRDWAAGVDPSDADAIVFRGGTYLEMERYDEALADFTRAIELGPDNAGALSFRGETYRQMGRFDEAAADFTRAIELGPDDAEVIGSRGETYLGMGRHDEALADFTRAIELDPAMAWILAARGETYRQMGRYEQAAADFAQAAELDPSYEPPDLT